SGIVQPASFLLIAWFAGRSTGRVELEDAALGAALIALWGATVWSAGAILRGERWQGTLSQILARPTGLGTVLLGKTLGATLRSAVFIGASVAATAALLGHAVSIERPLQFVIALVAVLVSALVLGFLLSSLFVLTRAAGRISEALLYPIFILGGMLVPVSLLPAWVQPLSAVVSLRWGGELMTAAAEGEAQPGKAWLMLVATTTAYAVLARLSFERVLVRSRREGALDLY
ncbi:MAG: ABC transporter permease, partial [Actinomycetota bacterium]|nr:ABC transporter permease [Actinomycetota bacterium]